MSKAQPTNELIERYLAEAAGPSELEELERRLTDDAQTADEFAEAAWFDALLQAGFAGESAGRQNTVILSEAKDLAGDTNSDEILRSAQNDSPPVLGFLGSSIQCTLSSGWPVAYLIATMVLGIGLLIGAVTHVSQPIQVVQKTLLSPFGRGPGGEGSQTSDTVESPVVGQITGVANCQYPRDSKTKDLRPKTAVSLGDKFNLISGLLEITYNTGARVILQGPVTYEVESPAGGFLSVGKLTAKVDKGSEIRDRSPDIPHPSTLIPHPLFVVRTPTAMVTDLGTEFGVEVARSGETTSHVFRGTIRVQAAAIDGRTRGDGHILRENESVRVESGSEREIVAVRPAEPSRFVREIRKQTIKVLDLVDVVAGGDGFSCRQNRGIDISNGRATAKVRPDKGPVAGDARYHRVAGLPFVDGVFAADGRAGRVQLDSAGHRFDGFPESRQSSGFHIWAGGAMPIPTTFVGPIKDSADFAYKYEMDQMPTTQDLDANGVMDMVMHESTPGNISVSGGKMTIVGSVGASDYIGSESTNPGTIWQNKFATGDYTAEWSAKVVSAPGGPGGEDGVFQMFASNGYRFNPLLSATDMKFGSPLTSIFAGSSTTGFHVYRLAKQGSACYLWRDGVLIGDSLTAAASGISMYFGDGGGAILGTAQVDYVRIQQGAYAPPASHDNRHARVVTAALAGVDYSSPSHGALWLHADKGITFDLDAIRRAKPGCRPVAFRAVAGVVEGDSTADHLADVWVFVDGRIAFRRRQVNRYSGAMPVVVPIKQGDRFLTLAAASADNEALCAWVVFADPQIELSSPSLSSTPERAPDAGVRQER
jgi:hypothetical protein